MARAAATRTTSSASAERRPVLDGKTFEATGVKLAVLPPAERISLRASAASVTALSKALGVKLPQMPKASATEGHRIAMWLGPDEWLVIDEAGGDLLADCAGVKAPHAAVGISHRNVAISVTGPAAANTLNAGCPRDLSLAAFPVGACSRTILGKVEIVLLRTAEDAFRVECWRSFSDYVWTFLTEAAGDAAA
jgi:sarcosine oxidase subunit gamma